MRKKIKHIKATTAIITILEIVLLAAFEVLYYLNIFELQTLVGPLAYQITILSVILINILLVWVSVISITSSREKSDLKAAEIIGNDIQEAYNFAQLGLVVTDESDMVLWTNDLFIERHIDIIDLNIISWCPKLKHAKLNGNEGETTKVSINNRWYEVRYLEDAGLWIFKDTSEYEKVYKYSVDQAVVIGVLSLDNFVDATHGDNGDTNDAVIKIKNVIFSYFKDFGVLLRRVKEDTYSLFCNYSTFERLKEDKFSVVKKVKQTARDVDAPITISMGIAFNFPDLIKLNEMAADALDIAISRGGDQVVISQYGHDIEFIGGTTSAVEKKNRVGTKFLADALLSLIDKSSDVLIMGHTLMDMDALGAALGVLAMCERMNKEAHIVVDLKATEAKTRSALITSFGREDIERIKYNSKEALNSLTADTLLVVVDVHAQKMTMCPELVDRATKIVVIDHHRRAEDYIDTPVLNHIDPSASSTSEIVTQFIEYASINPKIELPAEYATIILSGILLDTTYFKSRQTGVRTFESAAILRDFGADNTVADDYLKDDEEEYFMVTQLLGRMKYHSQSVVYVTADAKEEYDMATLAKAANACLSMKGIKAAFVIGTVDKQVRMSCRSDGTISVQIIAEKLGGGGNLSKAAVQFKGVTIQNAEKDLLACLDENINEAMSNSSTYKGDED